MEKSKVEFVYKNISLLNKISIVNKKIFRILPYICVPSLVIGGIAVFLKEMLELEVIIFPLNWMVIITMLKKLLNLIYTA